jgi:hypothetical protein
MKNKFVKKIIVSILTSSTLIRVVLIAVNAIEISNISVTISGDEL